MTYFSTDNLNIVLDNFKKVLIFNMDIFLYIKINKRIFFQSISWEGKTRSKRPEKKLVYDTAHLLQIIV